MIKTELESTGLEFAQEAELRRLYQNFTFWLNRGDHPTQSMTDLESGLMRVRREQMRRADPNEQTWI